MSCDVDEATESSAHSPILSLLLRHRLFTYVTWRAAHVELRLFYKILFDLKSGDPKDIETSASVKKETEGHIKRTHTDQDGGKVYQAIIITL